MLCVVPAHVSVVGRDDERHVRDPGVGQRTEDVIKKRPAVDREHGFASRVRGAPLPLAEVRSGIRLAHPRPQTTRQYYRSLGHMWRIGRGACVFQRPRLKSGKSTGADLRLTDWTLRPTTALIAAAS